MTRCPLLVFSTILIQIVLLEEMLLQLETFKNYAQKIGQSEIALIYEKTQKILRKIYDEKEDLKKPAETLENDGVYNAIKKELKTFD
jgi:hypothetical protein